MATVFGVWVCVAYCSFALFSQNSHALNCVQMSSVGGAHVSFTLSFRNACCAFLWSSFCLCGLSSALVSANADISWASKAIVIYWRIATGGPAFWGCYIWFKIGSKRSQRCFLKVLLSKVCFSLGITCGNSFLKKKGNQIIKRNRSYTKKAFWSVVFPTVTVRSSLLNFVNGQFEKKNLEVRFTKVAETWVYISRKQNTKHTKLKVGVEQCKRSRRVCAPYYFFSD